MTEQQIIEYAKTNPKYFGILYEKYFSAIFKFTYKRLASKEEAADITSVVFLKAMQHISSYKDTGFPFSSWLYRIATNELNMMFRKNKTQRIVSVHDMDLFSLIKQMGVHITEDEIEREEIIEKILQYLQELDEADLFLIEMRFFENKSFKEICDILNISEGNAKMKVYRILDKIRLKLNQS